MAKKKRTSVPAGIQKQLFKASGLNCEICRQTDVSTLVIHHRDHNPANNVLNNLLHVCANCHAKIHAGKYTDEYILSKVRRLPNAAPTERVKSIHRNPRIATYPNRLKYDEKGLWNPLRV